MQKFISFMEKNLLPIAAKIAGQKHLVAIRDAFAALMPLIMAGAFAVMINNVFLSSGSLLATQAHLTTTGFYVAMDKTIVPILNAVNNGTLSIMALGLVISLSYNRAKGEGKDALSVALIATGAFILLDALVRKDPPAATWVTNYLGSQGVFIALVVGLIAPAIYMAIVNKGWEIKMPEQVPPAVARGFSAIIPGTITLLFFGVISFIFTKTAQGSLFAWFETNLAQSLMSLSQGPVAIVAISLLIPAFWFFGLHGANILEAVMTPIYGALATQNVQYYLQGIRKVGDGTNNTLAVWVRGSWDAYVFVGGSGATLPLVIALILFSKVKAQKEIARLSLAPGLFEINEPVLFGLPIVLNPIYLIPFILVQPILTIIAYLASVSGFAGPIVNTIPWTTPPVLAAFLASNGNLGSTLISIINLVVAFLIYLPFVFVANAAETDNKA